MSVRSVDWDWSWTPPARRYVSTTRMKDRLFFRILFLVLAAIVPFDSHGSTTSNSNSPLGINLAPVNYYTAEQPFLNILHSGSTWSTHDANGSETNEEKYLNLDSDGYPITLTAVNDPNPQKFKVVASLMNRNFPATANGTYPSGQYVVLYDGEGTLAYRFDASLVSSSAGRDIINVAKPSSSGLEVSITSTDPKGTGNYLRNIRIVQATNEAALNAGQIFNPHFLSLMKNFRALRFMDWFSTNGSSLTSWSNRPLPSNAFWSTSNGVPLEVAIQLANTLSADAWLNVPIGVDDNYMTQMANLVKANLATNLKAYVELSNEVWNFGFSQAQYALKQGKIAFPSQPNQWYAGGEWYGMRVAQMGDIWYSVYGPTAFSSRVVIVMGGQAANSSAAQTSLSTPDWTGPGNGPAANHHIGAVAIAPYVMQVPSAADMSAILASPDGGVSELLGTAYAQEGYASVPTGGYIGQITSWIQANVKVASAYGLPVVAYEGGQGLSGFPTYLDGSRAINLFISVNLNKGMIPLHAAYFAAWKSAGGTLFMEYNDIESYSQYGEWGALQSAMETVSPLSSAPPKWQALQNFISSVPCWWANCAGPIGAVPMAPTNLVVK